MSCSLPSLRSSRPACPEACPAALADPQAWLERFHRGDKEVLSQVYQGCFACVEKAVQRVLHGADAETVVHEVFFRMVADQSFRERFHGGSLAAWFSTVARNRAIDFLRKRNREAPVEHDVLVSMASADDGHAALSRADAHRVIDQFVEHVLPKQLRSVFEARFRRELSQREAAKELSMARSSLAYQEQKILALLQETLQTGPALEA